MSQTSVPSDFLRSALTTKNPFLSTDDFHIWMKQVSDSYQHDIELIELDKLVNWGFNSLTGNLEQSSGKFFSIEGIEISTNWGNVPKWTQPIINQPEIGFLGIITKRFNGTLFFLMQAKAEPGNINGVQLSPTLQATKSNYTRTHKGAAPKYLEYFMEKRDDVIILLDQLQSEQGARFLKKRNRNIIIEVISDVEVEDSFCWLTLGQIKSLLIHDNIVNMDSRTVISGIPFEDADGSIGAKEIYAVDSFHSSLLRSELDSNASMHSIEAIISWITNHKFRATLEVGSIPLNSITDWMQDEYSIHHKDKKYFSVIGVRVELGNREVNSWTQPLVKSAQEGIIAFLIKKINGVYHFLVQAKLECGNFDIIELAPTVQCLTGNYREGFNEYEVDFLEYALDPEKNGGTIRYSSFQSEEGGRFYLEQNKNMIVEVGEEFSLDVPDRYIWMTLAQIKTFVRFNNYLNIQSRSLLSAVSFI